LSVPDAAGAAWSGCHAAPDTLSRQRRFPNKFMSTPPIEQFGQIQTALVRIERLAEELRADPDGNVRRSVEEVRAAFAAREPVEPTVQRMQKSLQMLRRDNQEGSRREYQRRAAGLDHLDQVVEGELLPNLRRLGFEV
jgi:hypothetical protein